MSDIEWSPVTVRLGDLSHWSDNPVTLSKAQAKKLLKSTERLGRMQTLAIGPANGDGKHPLYDGHQRVNVWGAAFGMELQVNALQSSRPLTDEERHQVPIMLRTATGSLDWDALAGWDANSLMDWGFDSDMLDGWKRDIAALGNLIESEIPEPQDAEPQIDRAEELQRKWQVKIGDLWRIGEHRLLCGDSTKREDVERAGITSRMAVFTDPPYGIDYDPRFLPKIAERHNQKLSSNKKVINDDMKLDLSFLWACDKRMVWGFPYIKSGDEPGWIVWDKQPGVESRGIVTPVEIASTTMRIGFDMVRVMWGGFYRASGEDRQPHPTQKPIGVYRPFIDSWTNKNDEIADYFSGSSPVMVACQNLSRKCRAIEISPAYCAVTLERMSTAFPALTIERI